MFLIGYRPDEDQSQVDHFLPGFYRVSLNGRLVIFEFYRVPFIASRSYWLILDFTEF